MNKVNQGFVRLSAKIIFNRPSLKAVLWDLDGKEFWIPKSLYKENEPGTIDIPEWYYLKTIKNEIH